MRRFLSLLGVSTLILLALPLSVTPANAASCPANPFIMVDSNGIIQPEVLYISIYTKSNPSASNTCINAAKTYWETQNTKYQANQSSKNANEFSRRLNACMGGVSASFTNVGSWVLSLKCLFQVSFFPTSQALKGSFNDLKTQFSSHQPTSYISVSVAVFNDLVNQWPTVGSCSDTAGGAEKFSFTDPSTHTALNFQIPCNPPSAMKPFRVLEVTGVYFGLIFYIYRTGMKFWQERQG